MPQYGVRLAGSICRELAIKSPKQSGVSGRNALAPYLQTYSTDWSSFTFSQTSHFGSKHKVHSCNLSSDKLEAQTADRQTASLRAKVAGYPQAAPSTARAWWSWSCRSAGPRCGWVALPQSRGVGALGGQREYGYIYIYILLLCILLEHTHSFSNFGCPKPVLPSGYCNSKAEESCCRGVLRPSRTFRLAFAACLSHSNWRMCCR